MKKGDKVLIQRKAKVGLHKQYLLVAREVERVTPKQFAVGGVKYWRKDFSLVGKWNMWDMDLAPQCQEYDESKDQTKLFNDFSEKEKLINICLGYLYETEKLMESFSTKENEKISSDDLRYIKCKLRSITNYLNNNPS